jgi:TRAP-type C4-dicarboxylate transport system substrate-binding protein
VILRSVDPTSPFGWEAAAIAAVQQSKISREQEAAALVRLRELGVQFDPLPPEARVALRQATAGVVDDVRKWVGADVVNKVLKANMGPAAAGEQVGKGSHR